MHISIKAPLNTWLFDPSVQAAVTALRARDAEKRVGLGTVQDCLEQTDYLNAWLAAQEICVAWHQQLSAIWQAVWKGNAQWNNATLTQLSSAEHMAVGWELPSLSKVWNDRWFGAAFRTSKGALVGLYIYGEPEQVYLNYECDESKALPSGWRDSGGELVSEGVAHWTAEGIDIRSLEVAATGLLSFLSDR